MKNTFDDKMTEIMIGEAVTALLDEDVAINWIALTERLRAAVEGETDEDRIRAGMRAIEEVRREMNAQKETGKTGAAQVHVHQGKLH